MQLMDGINFCPPPFINSNLFNSTGGYVHGRLCQNIAVDVKCCLPCPVTNWVYSDSFNTIVATANWVAVAGAICCTYLLASWAALPVEKTSRHYLSVSLTFGVLLMHLGFVVPLAARPSQCYDEITPHSMLSSKVCGASGSLLILGGWCGVMWALLRAFSLHLQVCWQVTVGRSFMVSAHAAGWGVPLLGIAFALRFSGLSFRFGPTCHINQENSLEDLWIPLLVFASVTLVLTFATFGYCVKVYLASLYDGADSTQGSSLTNQHTSIRSISPRQAYRRVRQVVLLQWRSIAIVVIIISDVIFFSAAFVFQDKAEQVVIHDPSKANPWVFCLITQQGDKNKCLKEARPLVLNEATVSAVLLLLSLNGIWLLLLLGRTSMLTAWLELFHASLRRNRSKTVHAAF